MRSFDSAWRSFILLCRKRKRVRVKANESCQDYNPSRCLLNSSVMRGCVGGGCRGNRKMPSRGDRPTDRSRKFGCLDRLDVGCDVRLTQRLINRGLPFAAYTGIEVYRPIIDWLKE